MVSSFIGPNFRCFFWCSCWVFLWIAGITRCIGRMVLDCCCSLSSNILFSCVDSSWFTLNDNLYKNVCLHLYDWWYYVLSLIVSLEIDLVDIWVDMVCSYGLSCKWVAGCLIALMMNLNIDFLCFSTAPFTSKLFHLSPTIYMLY